MTESNLSSSDQIPQLVAGLSDFRSRAQARQRLVELGQRAVPALLSCLNSSNEAVAWCAVQSLSELGVEESIEPLVNLLQKGLLVSEVADALSTITGKDFGTDASRWRLWLQGGAEEGADALVDAEVLMRAVVAGTTMALSFSGESFHLTVPLPEGPHQKVVVLFGHKDAAGNDLIIIYGDCGLASPQYYEIALRRNLKVAHSGFGIGDIEGEPHFLMVETWLHREATARALRKSIEHVARGALEKLPSPEGTS